MAILKFDSELVFGLLVIVLGETLSQAKKEIAGFTHVIKRHQIALSKTAADHF